MRRLARLALIVGGLVLAGGAFRDWVGFEPSGEWLRGWVDGFGIWGPVVYAGLMAVRHFFLLPSSLMLTLGGAAFGIFGGTLAGGIGLFLSGVLTFYIFRVVRPDHLVRRMEERYGQQVEVAERGMPLAVFLVTAVPPAPQTPLYWFVSFSRMEWGRFIALVFPSSVIRAFVLSVLGAGLIDSNPLLVVGAAAAIVVGLALCWLSPTVRELVMPAKAGPPRA